MLAGVKPRQYTYTDSRPHKSTCTDTLSAHTNTSTNSTKGLILFPSLADQGSVSGKYMYKHRYNVGPSSSWAQTFSLPSSCPWIPVPPVAGTWAYKPPRLLSHSSCWYGPLTHRHTPPHLTTLLLPLGAWAELDLSSSVLSKHVVFLLDLSASLVLPPHTIWHFCSQVQRIPLWTSSTPCT